MRVSFRHGGGLASGQPAVLTQGTGDGQEGDLVDDGAPPDWTVVSQPRPLPHDAVHTGLLNHTADDTGSSQSRSSAVRNYFIRTH